MTVADGKSVFMVLMSCVVYVWSIAPERAPLDVGSVLDCVKMRESLCDESLYVFLLGEW
tara:strand:- start:1449 stop:1625 length:177 start_codon:yes stop_codon:yes gene_type:complete